MEKLEIRKLNPSVGAEVVGFDPSAPLDRYDWKHLSQALNECVMLAFRGIDLSVARQHEIVELIQAGGDLGAVGGIEMESFSYVSNKEEDGGAPYGRLLYHSDMMWSELPNQTPSLYAVDAQQPATPTVYVNTAHAWKTLPDDLKERVEGLSARHESGQQGRGNTDFEHELIQPKWGRLHETVKPIAVRHPRTGETLLYVCEQQTREIVGLPEDESTALLDRLFEHMYRPECCLAHVWHTGDLVVWDNMSAQHSRPYVEGGGSARTLRKIHAPYTAIRNYMSGIGGNPTYDKAM